GYLTVVPESLTDHTVLGIEYAKINKIYKSLFKKDIAIFCNKFPPLYMELVSCFDIGSLKKERHPNIQIIPNVQNKTLNITYEFKHTVSDDSDIIKDVTKKALKQIVDNNYQINLLEYVKEIVEVGIAFCDKVAFVSARCLKCNKKGITTNEN
ncbi:1071_t:CDS:2, partial [Funneliformis mosseae]